MYNTPDEIGAENKQNRGAKNGYCPLGGDALVPLDNIPSTLTGKDADTVDSYDSALAVTNNTIPVRTSEGIIEQCWHYIKVSDVKSQNTAGQTLTAATWNKRDINTEDNDTGGNCSISSSQITLDAGTYECRITAPAYASGIASRLRLQNITDAATELLGDNTEGTVSVAVRAEVKGRFTIAAQKTFEVQHYTATGNLGGRASNISGVSEIYTIAEFWKVA